MPEDVTPAPVATPTPPTSTASPVTVDTQSAPIPGSLQPPAAAPAAPRPMEQPQTPPPPGSFMKNLSHSFVGAVLGGLAGNEKTVRYTTDENGKQMPVVAPKTRGDQLRDIARAALMGLSAGANVPRQKSGLGSALAGFGAGAEETYGQAKEKDLLMRKQSSEEFERGQKALLDKAQNAHIAVETMAGIANLRKATMESQGQLAALGQDAVDAALAGGNAVAAQDVHMNDLLKYKSEHPEYVNYMPVLTKVVPREGADPNDPNPENSVDRYYSLIDYSKPVEITQPMVDHLKAVNFPGAENLQAGQKIDPRQFKALWYQGLKMYNAANMDRQNWHEIEDHDAAGNSIMVSHNDVTGLNRVLINPLTQKPMTGKDDPLAKIEHDPTELAGDKAAAAIPQLQNWLTMTNDPERRDRITRAIGVAKSAQQAYEAEKQREAAALNAVRQGDPNDAAQLLVDGKLTLSDLKARGSTPEFIVAASRKAVEISGGKYNPADEVVAEQVAKSPQLIQFFGSANSLLSPGGTLDQLLELGKKIPAGQLPALNSVADWEQLAAGQGPLAGYAAKALGVADDYSKVMTGGVGSDMSRDQALKLFAANESPEQRVDSINATRGAVLSQRNERIGPNQFLRRSYGNPVSAGTMLNTRPVNPQNGLPYQSYSVGPNKHVIGYNGQAWVDAATGLPLPPQGQAQ